jgi:hypothetical protein
MSKNISQGDTNLEGMEETSKLQSLNGVTDYVTAGC